MCTQVLIIRPGLRPIECGSVRELARWFTARPVPPGEHLDRSTSINRMADHCLCPVDVGAWATASGYAIDYDAGDYVATKK